MGEKELIERIRDREEQGAEDLLRHYGPLMRYIIEPILANPQDREECLSEAAVRVWDGIGGYDPARGSWTAWLTAVTRNTALNRLRKLRRGTEELSEHTPAPQPPPGGGSAGAGAAGGAAALLPEILLYAVHGADCRRAGPDAQGGGGAAVPHQGTAEKTAGR